MPPPTIRPTAGDRRDNADRAEKGRGLPRINPKIEQRQRRPEKERRHQAGNSQAPVARHENRQPLM
jgi:hypothetical protein